MLPSRVGVRMHFSNGFCFFFGCAPKVRPSRSYRKNQWNLMIFKVGSDARATEAAQEACRKLARKNAFPKRNKHAFSSFFLFLASPRRGSKKCCQNGLRSPPGEAPGDPAGAQNRSTSRLRPARGARQVMFGILGGLPGRPGEGPGGPRSLQDPPGRLQGKLVPKVWYYRAFQRWTP